MLYWLVLPMRVTWLSHFEHIFVIFLFFIWKPHPEIVSKSWKNLWLPNILILPSLIWKFEDSKEVHLGYRARTMDAWLIGPWAWPRMRAQTIFNGPSHMANWSMHLLLNIIWSTLREILVLYISTFFCLFKRNTTEWFTNLFWYEP